MGEDASQQPGNLSEVYPHETAVAWLRAALQSSKPTTPWRETTAQYATQLKGACRQINADYDVAGLCRTEFLKRVRLLIDGEGERLRQ